jgi:ABC-type transport system substrate-binding protein
MTFGWRHWALGLATAAAAATSGVAAETPKRGGTLTYLIPADAPPSLDAHRETTYVTVHTGAPFYSVLIRVNPDNPSSTTDFVCDLCTEMPKPTDGGVTYTFNIRPGVKFHDGSPLTAEDVAATWNSIVFPPAGMLSPRSSNFEMVDKIEMPDPQTVVFRLKFATAAFLPALADPYGWIYEKRILDKDPHWYEKNIMGSGPFKFVSYEIGQAIRGERNPDYYHPGQPYLDAIVGLYAPKQATRIDALRSDRAAIEFRGLPPAARDELKAALGKDFAEQAQHRQPADRRAALPLQLDQQAELRQLRGSEGTRHLRQSLPRDRSGQAEAANVPVRQARHGYRGAQTRAALVAPDRAVSRLCERLENQPQPLHQPGSGEHLAGQISRACGGFRRAQPASA